MIYFSLIESRKSVFIPPQYEVNFRNDYGKVIMAITGVLFNCSILFNIDGIFSYSLITSVIFYYYFCNFMKIELLLN